METAKRSIKICMVCEKEANKGIHIFQHFLCAQCEQKLILTNTDEEEYQYFIEKLRKINHVSC